MTIFDTRDDLISSFPKDMVICEIGVFKGEFSEKILSLMHPKELKLVDIFHGKMCSGDKDGNYIVWTDLEDEYSKLKQKYSTNEKVSLLKGKSSLIMKEFPDYYFDLIYIDGDHSYEGVLSDLTISNLKVKENGYICGHDYISPRFDGVVRAVNEFCEKNNLKINYLTKDGCPSYCIKKI
jgi:hypothetical protein